MPLLIFFSGVAMFVFFALEHWYYYQVTTIATEAPPAAHLRTVTEPAAKQLTNTAVVHRLLTAVAGAVTSVANMATGGKPAAPAGAVVNQVVDGAVMSSIGAVHVPEKAMSTISKIMLFEGWAKPDFLALFLIAAFLGSVLNYSIFLCTTINSALTTAVVGCLKNVLTTYIGMIVFPDYVFEWMNFIGLNISIAGSLYYTYFTMFKGFQGFGQ